MWGVLGAIHKSRDPLSLQINGLKWLEMHFCILNTTSNTTLRLCAGLTHAADILYSWGAEAGAGTQQVAGPALCSFISTANLLPASDTLLETGLKMRSKKLDFCITNNQSKGNYCRSSRIFSPKWIFPCPLSFSSLCLLWNIIQNTDSPIS